MAISRSFLLIIVTCIFYIPSISAQPGVTVSQELMPDNSLSIRADITGAGNFTIELIFSDRNNTDVPHKQRFTINRSREITRLAPLDPGNAVSAVFRYDWLHGQTDAPADTRFVYRLPFTKGMSSVPVRIPALKAGVFNKNILNFTMWMFGLPEGSPVYAMRKGTVIRIEGFDSYPERITPELIAANRITVEHADGTLAIYSSLGGKSPGIKEGGQIGPDTIIGSAGLTDRELYGVGIRIFYYVSAESDNRLTARQRYIDPVFASGTGSILLTEGQAVTAAVNKKMINKERYGCSLWCRIFGKNKR